MLSFHSNYRKKEKEGIKMLRMKNNRMKKIIKMATMAITILQAANELYRLYKERKDLNHIYARTRKAQK